MKYLENGIEVDGKFYSLLEITTSCNKVRIENQDLVLMKIEWEGRGGNVHDYNLYPKIKANRIQELLVGKEVYFGEIWGKHSEVYGDIDKDDIEIINDKNKIKDFLVDHPNGAKCNYSFIQSLLETYEDNGGREEYLESEGEDYCNDLEELRKLYYDTQ